MSWNKSVVENTLEFSDEFLKDLLKISEKIDYDPYGDDEEEILEDLREWLFHPDHMEWMGSWLDNDEARKIIKSHKLTGHIIFTEEDYGPSGIKFVDGDVASEELKLEFV
jgi:hypothetical protein